MRIIIFFTLYILVGSIEASSNQANKQQESDSSNFISSRDMILPSFGDTPPNKGESRLDPTTGAKITRLTDVSDLNGTDSALIVYSRYSPENTSGEYFLVFGDDSHTSWVINRETGNITNQLRGSNSKTIGEVHEVRWDLSGNHPNRIYYRYDMKFYKIDDVASSESTPILLKDFSDLVPGAGSIRNDVEGDSSNDSDHWAFMATHYDEDEKETFVDAFIHYQISTGATHILTPSDLAGSNLDIEKDKTAFTYRPNMVEVSPLGTGIIIHTGRRWGEPNPYIGTWFDGPHLWPLNFDYNEQVPIKVSIDETHSGWSFDEGGREMFISQNNRTDDLDAVYIEGANAGYANRMIASTHADFGWSNGFHYGKMPPNKKGWIFISTYSDPSSSSHDSNWGADQLIMMQLKPMEDDPIVWRISSNYNLFDGGYRDEAPAAINHLGNRIYLTTNWGGNAENREVYVIELPNDWNNISNFE